MVDFAPKSSRKHRVQYLRQSVVDKFTSKENKITRILQVKRLIMIGKNSFLFYALIFHATVSIITKDTLFDYFNILYRILLSVAHKQSGRVLVLLPLIKHGMHLALYVLQ